MIYRSLSIVWEVVGDADGVNDNVFVVDDVDDDDYYYYCYHNDGDAGADADAVVVVAVVEIVIPDEVHKMNLNDVVKACQDSWFLVTTS